MPGRADHQRRATFSAWAISCSGVSPSAPSSSSLGLLRASSRGRRGRRGRAAAGRRRGRRRSGRPAGAAPTFSRSSTTIRSAVRLPIPGTACRRAVSPGRDRGQQLARRAAGQHRERHLRPDGLDADQQQEEVALGLGGEAVEQQRVVADDQVGVERRRLADRGRVAQRLGRHGQPVADAAAGRRRRGRCAARRPRRSSRAITRPRSPCRRPRRAARAPLAWQMATASASAAWSGRGSSVSAEQRLDHALDLLLVRAPRAADRALDLLGRVGEARAARAGPRRA